MSNTYRKDRSDKIFKESLKKKDSNCRHRCRCGYCLGKKNTLDKIAEKDFEIELKTIIEEGTDCDIPEQDKILKQIIGK